MKEKLKKLIKCSVIRASYTIAETALGIIGSATLINDVDWKFVLSASLLSGIVSLLKSIIVGLPEVENGD